MDAREIIKEAIVLSVTRSVTTKTDAILSALRCAGYTIIHRDENHGPTRERAARIADIRAAMTKQVSHEAALALLQAIPDAIRAMEAKHDA